MDNQVLKHSIYYYAVVIVLTGLSVVNTFSNSHQVYYGKMSILFGAILFLLAVINYLLKGVNLKDIIFVVSILFIWSLTKFNAFFTIPILVALTFVNHTPWQVIKAYYLSNLYCLIITIALALVGISPMRNVIDGIISLGFANENTLGLFTLLISLFYTLEIVILKKKTRRFYIKLCFILVFIILNIFIIADRTVVLVFLLFLLFVGIFKMKNTFLTIILDVFGCLCPLLLTYSSLYLLKNYNKNNFYYSLNDLLSNRIYMWNWYYYKIPITWYSNNLKISQFNFWGTIDGSYTNLLFQSGLVTTVVVCLLLVYSNFLLLKDKKNYIFCLLVSLEIGAFSENILQSPAIIFVMTFVILSLYPKWLNDNKYKNL